MPIALEKNNVSFGSLIVKFCPSILSMIVYKTSLLKLPINFNFSNVYIFLH